MFSLNTGAYAAEVFRAGIQSIERGQIEAARGLGSPTSQAMRFAIVPQAVRRVIPPLLNEFVILIKDTALIIVLGLLVWQFDLLSVGRRTATRRRSTRRSSSGRRIGYLAITLPLIGLVNYAERRLRSGLVGVTVGQAGLGDGRATFARPAWNSRRALLLNDDGSMVRVEGLHKWFGTNHVLKGIDLTLPQATCWSSSGRPDRGSRRCCGA